MALDLLGVFEGEAVLHLVRPRALGGHDGALTLRRDVQSSRRCRLLGPKRTCRGHPALSALGGKADMADL